MNVIDNIDKSITSNIRVKIENLNALINQFAQYELCFVNRFNVKPEGLNIKSTGFNSGTIWHCIHYRYSNAVKLTGVISIVKRDETTGTNIVVVKSAERRLCSWWSNLTTINIVSTDKPNNIVEVQAFPDSNDVIGLQDLYLEFNIPNSTINMVKDTITSGEQISGVGYKVTSSYANGELTRT